MHQSRKASDLPSTSTLVQVSIATISAMAILGAALLANWDKFGTRNTSAAEVAAAARSTGATALLPSVQVNSAGSESPVVAGVNGNVTVNVGGGRTDGVAKASPFTGHWESRDGDYLSSFDLEVSGTAVTGSTWFRGQEWTLHDGRIHGDALEFTTRGTGQGGEAEILRYRGVLDGKIIRFALDIESANSKHRTFQFTATRE